MISAKEAMAHLHHVCRGQDFDPAKRYHVFIEGRPETMHETNSRLACWWYEIKLGWIGFDQYSGHYTMLNRVYTLVTDDKAFARHHTLKG